MLPELPMSLFKMMPCVTAHRGWKLTVNLDHMVQGQALQEIAH